MSHKTQTGRFRGRRGPARRLPARMWSVARGCGRGATAGAHGCPSRRASLPRRGAAAPQRHGLSRPCPCLMGGGWHCRAYRTSTSAEAVAGWCCWAILFYGPGVAGGNTALCHLSEVVVGFDCEACERAGCAPATAHGIEPRGTGSGAPFSVLPASGLCSAVLRAQHRSLCRAHHQPLAGRRLRQPLRRLLQAAARPVRLQNPSKSVCAVHSSADAVCRNAHGMTGQGSRSASSACSTPTPTAARSLAPVSARRLCAPFAFRDVLVALPPPVHSHGPGSDFTGWAPNAGRPLKAASAGTPPATPPHRKDVQWRDLLKVQLRFCTAYRSPDQRAGPPENMTKVQTADCRALRVTQVAP